MSAPYQFDPTGYAHDGAKLNANSAYHDAEISALQAAVSGAPLTFTAQSVNVDATGDKATFAISLPAGYTRYIVTGIYYDNASHTLATAKAGLYTAASAGGAAILANTDETIESVTATADATAANAAFKNLAGAAVSCKLSSTPTIYFNVGTSEGSAATVDVAITIQPMP